MQLIKPTLKRFRNQTSSFLVNYLDPHKHNNVLFPFSSVLIQIIFVAGKGNSQFKW